MQRWFRGGDHPWISLRTKLDGYRLPWRERPRAGRRLGSAISANAWSLTPRFPTWSPRSAAGSQRAAETAARSWRPQPAAAQRLRRGRFTGTVGPGSSRTGEST